MNTAAGPLADDELSIKSQMKKIVSNPLQSIVNVAKYVMESAACRKAREEKEQEQARILDELREVERAYGLMLEAERERQDLEEVARKRAEINQNTAEELLYVAVGIGRMMWIA